MGREPYAPHVSVVRLEPGIDLYLLRRRAVPRFDLIGLLEGGLCAEPAEESGVADLVLSMLDRGTPARDEQAIARLLESLGAQLAYRLTRETAIVEVHGLSEDLEPVVALMGETLCRPTFPAAELVQAQREAQAALREEAHDGFERAYQRAAARFFGERHPYARSLTGAAAIIPQLGREALARHHARTIAADRLTLAAVGDFDATRMSDALNAALAPLAKRAALGPAPLAPQRRCKRSPPRRQRAGTSAGAPPLEHVALADKEQVDLVWLGPGVARDDPGFDAAALASFLIGGSFVSRLNARLRDREGLTYGAHCGLSGGRAPGCWYATLGVEPAAVERAVRLVTEELSRFAGEGPVAGELEAARQHLAGAHPLRLETNRSLAAAMLALVRHGRPLTDLDRYPERLAALDGEAVTAAARRMVDFDQITVATAGAGPAPAQAAAASQGSSRPARSP